MTASGFSSASTAPCCNAVKSSENAIGVGLAPQAWKDAMWMGFSCVRMDSPFSASGEVASMLFVVMWR